MKKKGNTDDSIINIKYPLTGVVLVYFIVPAIYYIVMPFDVYISILFLSIWTFSQYIYIARRYKSINLYVDRMIITYFLFPFTGIKQFKFHEIDNVFFQEHGSFYDNPYFNVNLKNGKKKRFRLPMSELMQVKVNMRELGIKTITSRYAGEGMGW